MPKIDTLPDDLTQEHCVYGSFTVRKMFFLVVAFILFSVFTMSSFFIINKVISYSNPSKKIEQDVQNKEDIEFSEGEISYEKDNKSTFKYGLIINLLISIIIGLVPFGFTMFVGFKKNKERDMYYEKLWKEKIAFKYKTKLYLYTKR